MRRSAAVSTRMPSILYSAVALNRMMAVANQAMPKAIVQSIIRLGSWVASSMTAAMPEGPATQGMASGTMNGSPSGTSPNTPSLCGKIMRMPIKNRTMPPAMETDS